MKILSISENSKETMDVENDNRWASQKSDNIVYHPMEAQHADY